MKALLEPVQSADSTHREMRGDGEIPSNENWPILELRPTGNGTALARMLVRVLVHRALIHEGAICVADDCTKPTRAG